MLVEVEAVVTITTLLLALEELVVAELDRQDQLLLEMELQELVVVLVVGEELAQVNQMEHLVVQVALELLFLSTREQTQPQMQMFGFLKDHQHGLLQLVLQILNT
jgi:hypothetical protein